MKFKGVIPALFTPLDKNEELNVATLEKYVEYLIGQGADGFYIGGASGEGIVLPKEVRMKLAEKAVEFTNKRVPTVIHIGSAVFKDAVELAKHAEKIGADAISSVPPIYFKYNQDSIYEYYEKLASCTDLPLMIYNTPAAGYLLDGEFAAKLCGIKNVTAIKWTSPQYFELIKMRDLLGGDINVLNGPDETMLLGLSSGADGAIGVSYSAALPTARGVYDSFIKGDMKTALEYQTKLTRLLPLYRKYPSIAVNKAVLESRGFDFGDAVFPQRRLTFDEKKEIVEAYENALK